MASELMAVSPITAGEAAIPLATLLLEFQSLGDNCEFGLVQRQAGAEPLGLLRFASPYVPIKLRLQAVANALHRGFSGLGGLDTVQLKLEGNSHRREYIAYESVYQLMHHTNVHEGEVDPDEFRRKEARRLIFLRDKLMVDLAAGEKIWLWKSNLPLSRDDIRPLLDALRRHGPNTLLWVAAADPAHASGTVERLERDLLKGYVDRFAPYDNAPNISFDSWYAVCRAAHARWHHSESRNGAKADSCTDERKEQPAAVMRLKGASFSARSLLSLTTTVGVDELKNTPFSRAVLDPAGTIEMPACYVANRPSNRYDIPGGWGNPGWGYPNEPALIWDGPHDRIFPSQISYPEVSLARLDDVYYLPYASPFLPESKILVNDFLVPWGPGSIGWFKYEGEGTYSFPFDLAECDSVDEAFFMGHPVSGHFGHFIGDCLSRMHAWQDCRNLFPNAKVILDHAQHETRFRKVLLEACGVNAKDLLIVQRPLRCRKLLLASPAMGVEQYASPRSAKLWRQISNAFGNSLTEAGNWLYLSRSGQLGRKLANEPDVEAVFKDFGFQIMPVEGLPIEDQVSAVSSAELVAGPGGSGMFNLAFQKRLRSVLIMRSETSVQITEWLILAGTRCPIYYHIGSRDMPGGTPVTGRDPWRVDLSRLTSDIETWLSLVYGPTRRQRRPTPV